MEMCSVTRVTKEAKKLHLKAGPDMDLRNGWNVDLAAKREESFEYIRKVRPLTIIGSPMCTMFSQLQSLSGRTRSKQGKHSKAACHMEFMAKVHMGTRGRRMVFRTRTFTSSNILEVEAHGGSWGGSPYFLLLDVGNSVPLAFFPHHFRNFHPYDVVPRFQVPFHLLLFLAVLISSHDQ